MYDGKFINKPKAIIKHKVLEIAIQNVAISAVFLAIKFFFSMAFILTSITW